MEQKALKLSQISISDGIKHIRMNWNIPLDIYDESAPRTIKQYRTKKQTMENEMNSFERDTFW